MLRYQHASPLFGSGYGFGRAFAYAKQVTPYAAGVTYPDEALPSAGRAALPCQLTPEAHSGARQNSVMGSLAGAAKWEVISKRSHWISFRTSRQRQNGPASTRSHSARCRLGYLLQQIVYSYYTAMSFPFTRSSQGPLWPL